MRRSRRLATTRCGCLTPTFPHNSGRLITGPSQSVFIFNLCLIFGATTLFYVFIASRIHMSLVVIGSILQAITLYFLFLAAFTEPGIVKRGAPTAIEAKEPPMVTVGKDRVKLRWCKTCRIYRPPRCKHCRFCDNCVEEFDHHCPWVMNCVVSLLCLCIFAADPRFANDCFPQGKRNYRYFVAFVASVAVLAVFVFVCTLAFLIIGATKGGVTPVGTMVSIALLLLTGKTSIPSKFHMSVPHPPSPTHTFSQVVLDAPSLRLLRFTAS